MLRVIHQELAHDQASQEFFLHGAGKKNETFKAYLRRRVVQVFTPEPKDRAAVRTERAVNEVRQRLGRFYRPPIKA